MLRLVDVVERTTDHVTFRTEEITASDYMIYVIFDTSSGIALPEDYYGWRSTTTLTSTGATTVDFTISNANLYPTYIDPVIDYTLIRPRLLQYVTLNEYEIIHDTLIRLDLVRRRLPNPGFTIDSTNSVGQNGTVAMSGGFYKKMSVEEIIRMMAATIVEINATPPRTSYWPIYQDETGDKLYNPYSGQHGWPYEMRDLTVLGTVIRCLVSVGILEVDISFSTSDSGLQLTFDRSNQVKGWHDTLLQEYKETKQLFKWNHANHRGVGVGTYPWMALGTYGTMMQNAMYGGELALTSVMGFSRGNVPL